MGLECKAFFFSQRVQIESLNRVWGFALISGETCVSRSVRLLDVARSYY